MIIENRSSAEAAQITAFVAQHAHEGLPSDFVIEIPGDDELPWVVDESTHSVLCDWRECVVFFLGMGAELTEGAVKRAVRALSLYRRATPAGAARHERAVRRVLLAHVEGLSAEERAVRLRTFAESDYHSSEVRETARTML